VSVTEPSTDQRSDGDPGRDQRGCELQRLPPEDRMGLSPGTVGVTPPARDALRGTMYRLRV
jgi:hypothetical protein